MTFIDSLDFNRYHLFFPAFLFLLSTQLLADPKSQYRSLDPTSISQHLAYYELYKDTPDGDRALGQAWKLLSGKEGNNIPLSFPNNVNAFLSLINSSGPGVHLEISDEALSSLEAICEKLPNRKLKGHRITTQSELAALPSEEIDLSRALIIAQGESDVKKARLLEAGLDLMALQVLARHPISASAEKKIAALNDLIFFELGFRFPPHSSYSQEIDLYTFLPQVLESRRGVCLGVCTLYLCLAQRIGLELEIITPPGHIYLRCGKRNIETTLRGVHIPDQQYLGINLIQLRERKLKEVVGMAFFNQASVYLSQADFQKAQECYVKALTFMPNDRTLNILYASSLFLCNQEEKAREILAKLEACEKNDEISEDTLKNDLLEGKADQECLRAMFLYVDETRASIIKKKEALEKALDKSPQFRSGIFQLAICWLQLARPQEAIRELMRYHELWPHDIKAEFYLVELYLSRYNAPKAKSHFKRVEEIAAKSGHSPIALRSLKAELSIKCP